MDYLDTLEFSDINLFTYKWSRRGHNTKVIFNQKGHDISAIQGEHFIHSFLSEVDFSKPISLTTKYKLTHLDSIHLKFSLWILSLNPN